MKNKWKAKIIVVIWLLSLTMVYPSLASDYPQPVGYVNDFAGLLRLSDVQKLEGELKAFDNQTTNEVVVVTVNSLEGLSARAYTIGLANDWKVGKKIKNNGVVFLIAPNEREVDIEVGSGLDQILTQSAVDDILDNEVVPYLRDDQWSGGIFAGAHGIMNRLGGQVPVKNVPVQNVNPPVQNVNPPVQEQAPDPTAFLMIIGFIVIAIIVILVGYWIRGKYKLKKENQQSFIKCQEKISALEAARITTNQILETIVQNNPMSVWKEPKQNFDNIVINEIWQELFNIQDKMKEGFKTIDAVRDDIEKLDKKIDSYSDTYDKIKILPEEINRAQTESINLIASLPETIVETKKAVGQVDVFDETKLSFENAEKKFPHLIEKSKESKIDWLDLRDELHKLSNTLNNIQSKADSDRMTAAKARSEGPRLLKELPELIERLERKIDSAEARNKLEEAKLRYQEVSSSQHRGNDWASTYLTLLAVNNLIDDAERTHHHHVEAVEAERRRRIAQQRSSSGSWQTHQSSYSGGGGGGFGNVGGSRKF